MAHQGEKVFSLYTVYDYFQSNTQTELADKGTVDIVVLFNGSNQLLI